MLSFVVDGKSIRDARGWHFYFRPPEGKAPMKVHVAYEGVTASGDGYVVTAPALYPTGWVYEMSWPTW
jgi:hypothetical protein